MLAKIASLGLFGIDGFAVTVECDISNGLPDLEIVGLPDAAVKEARERVKSAIRNSGFSFPDSRIVVNLAPADTRKEGPVYDLPIAVGLLCATGQVRVPEGMVFVGELSLSGEIRPVRGLTPMLISAREAGCACVFAPPGNADEAAIMEGLTVYTPRTLQELVRFLRGEAGLTAVTACSWEEVRKQHVSANDFCFIKGQHDARRAAEIACAGGHNLIMIGPPGSGKTMIARAIPSILPELTFDEALEATKIHSVSGTLDCGLIAERPFRAPHHTASVAALAGGGPKAKPGEVSLAHNGVLFLDELPEYNRGALESLRQPLEDGRITVSRAMGTVTYPAQFMLVASMNPCPCGNFGSKTQKCTCTPTMIMRYLARISGPLLDRIDLQVEVDSVAYEELSDRAPGEKSADIRARVQAAREIQNKRFAGTGVHCNAQMSAAQLQEFCRLSPEGEELLKKAFKNLNMSARGYNRILKVARTVADLKGENEITPGDLALAVSFRNLDRKYWLKK